MYGIDHVLNVIEKVEVSEATNDYIVVCGEKRSRHDERVDYYDTFEEAQSVFLNELNNKLDQCNKGIALYTRLIDEVSKMTAEDAFKILR